VNKHIKQFERVSGIEVYGIGLDRVKWESRLEAYTRLIVQECAEIARLNTRVDSKVYLMIQEHFGVEE
jgi:hypothetical protein